MTTEQRLTEFAQAVGADIKDIREKMRTFEFTQMVPAYTWTITHNLDKFPSVEVVDSAGTVVIGNVSYINNNQIELEFSFQFSGKAYLN